MSKVEISFNYRELVSLQMQLIASFMFLAHDEEDLEKKMTESQLYQEVVTKREILHRKEVDKLLDAPGRGNRSQLIKNFKELERLDAQQIEINYLLFRQNTFLDKFRAIARNELKADTEKLMKIAKKHVKTIAQHLKD